MKENRQGCLSRSIRADALKSAKRYVLPRPKTHKPAPTQGEGCVKGGPSAGPPFAFNQSTDQVFAGGMRSPRHQKRTPPWGRSFLVRKMGLEPTHKMYWLLRPARLPFRHFRREQPLSYHDRSPAVKPGDENRWALAALRLDRRQPASASLRQAPARLRFASSGASLPSPLPCHPPISSRRLPFTACSRGQIPPPR